MTLFPKYTDEEQSNFVDEMSVVYDISTPEFKDSIDIDLLIDSLSGLNDIFETLSILTDCKLSLKVNATKRGSVDVLFNLVVFTAAVTQIFQWLEIDKKTAKEATANALHKINHLMMRFLKKSKGDIQEFIRYVKDDAKLHAKIKELLIQLRNNARFCDGLDDFTKPLGSGVVNGMVIHHGETIIAEMEKEDRQAFKIGTTEIESTANIVAQVNIVYLSPQETRWKFRTTEGEFWANVEDDDFLKSVKTIGISSFEKNKFEANITVKTTLKKNARRPSKYYVVTRIKSMRDLFSPLDDNSQKEL